MAGSHYRDFVTAGKADRSYLLQVNTHGQVVIYLLGANGQPTSWAGGPVEEVIQLCLQGTYPDAQVLLAPDDEKPWGSIQCYGTKYPRRWRDMVKVMNGPASQKRAVFMTAFYNSPFAKLFIQWQGHGKGYAVTARGAAADKKMDEEQKKWEATKSPQTNGAVP